MPDLPETSAVEHVMAKIHGSPEFVRAPVMRHLLKYLVDETLAGRGDRLKAYSVAVDALGRSPDFDASVDSYPRVQVGRLRRMLEGFYALNPEVLPRLKIPLGAYRVDFGTTTSEVTEAETPATELSPHARPQPRRWPWVAGGAALLALGLALAVVFLWRVGGTSAAAAPALVPPPTLAVEAGETGAPVRSQVQLGEITRLVGTAIARSGVAQVTTGGASVQARFGVVVDMDARGTAASLRLIDRVDGRLLWSETAPIDEGDLSALRAAISALIRPSGFLPSLMRREHRDDFRPGYPCLVQYSRYFRVREPGMREAVKRCVARSLAIDPAEPRALAAASFLVIDPLRGPQASHTLRRAQTFARRAITADPTSAEALVAEARVALIGGSCTRGRSLAERAIGSNDFNTENIASMGLLLARCDREQSRAWLDEAERLDPDLPNVYSTALIAMAVDTGDRARAIEVADRMRPAGDGTEAFYHIGQTLAAIAGRDAGAAKRHWDVIVRLAPPPHLSVDQVLANYYLSPDIRTIIGRQIDAAGIGSE